MTPSTERRRPFGHVLGEVLTVVVLGAGLLLVGYVFVLVFIAVFGGTTQGAP